MNRLLGWYRGRPATQRRIIAFVVVAVVVAQLLALVIQAQRSRDRLVAELPRLRASIAALERDADEVRRLRATPTAQPQAGTPLASLATNAGGVTGAQVSVIDERRVGLTGADVSFAALLEWLNGARATHGMRVESARIEANPSPGRVRAELVLVRA